MRRLKVWGVFNVKCFNRFSGPIIYSQKTELCDGQSHLFVSKKLAKLYFDRDVLYNYTVGLQNHYPGREHGSVNASIGELDIRVDTLEDTVSNHETRLTAGESQLEGIFSHVH